MSDGLDFGCGELSVKLFQMFSDEPAHHWHEGLRR
jgi:hypothetical protein